MKNKDYTMIPCKLETRNKIKEICKNQGWNYEGFFKVAIELITMESTYYKL